MGSSISNFKPLIFAAIIIGMIEAAIIVFSLQGPYGREFFEFAFAKTPNLQKIILFEKLERLLPKQPSEIVFVGDSAGFFGVQPKIIMESIGEKKAVNLACCGDTGFDGYLHVAEYALKTNESTKMLVFYMTPMIGPFNFKPDGKLARSIKENFNDWKANINPPSFSWRLPVANFLYYWRTDSYFMENDKLPGIWGRIAIPGFSSTQKLQNQILDSFGWVPLDWNKKPMEDRCEDNMLPATKDRKRQKRFTEAYGQELVKWLQSFYELSRKYDTQLAVMFNPVPCQISKNGQDRKMVNIINSFLSEHPDILVPFKLLEQWSDDQFSDPWHLNREGSEARSKQIGQILSSYFANIDNSGG